MHVRLTETETRINSRLRSCRNPSMDPYHKTEIQCLPSNHNHPNVSHIYYFLWYKYKRYYGTLQEILDLVL
jgi:hypothetical protein